MAEEIDVLAVKKSIPDMHGRHLWDFLLKFGVPSSHGVYYGKYEGYETYGWTGCGGKVEFYFNSCNLCVADSLDEFVSDFLKKH